MLKLKYSWPYIVVFCSIAALVLYSTIYTQKDIDNNLSYFKTINIAGRQRMLSQKIIKEYYKALAGEDIEQQWHNDIEHWNEVHFSLQNGESGLSIHCEDHPGVRNSFAALNPVQASLYKYLKRATTTPKDSSLLAKINETEARYLLQMDAITDELQQNANADLEISESRQIRTTVISALVLILIIIFVVYPYHKKLVLAYKSRKQQQQILEEQNIAIDMLNKTHELTLDGITAGVWDWDILTGKEKWSTQFYKLLGYEPGEIPATFDTFINILVHPDDKDRVAKVIDSHLKHKTPYKEEIRLLNKNNTYRWYEGSGKAVWNEQGVPVRMAGSIFDITPRVTYRTQVEYNEFLLEEAGKMAKLGGWEFDIHTEDMKWSKAMFDINELPYGSSLVYANRMDSYPKEYHELIAKSLANAVKNKRSYDIELELITAKGNRKWVRSIGIPIINADGEVVKMRGIYQDISIQKQKERELVSTKERLHDANKTKDKLLSIVAHDIRGPIINLKGLIELKKDDAISQEEFMDYMEKVGVNIDYLLNEMDNILQWAQSQMRGLTVNRDKIEINDVIASTANLYKTAAANKHISFQYSGSDKVFAFADYNHTHLIIRNLLNNAVKFTPIGGNITVDVLKINGDIKIAVKDSGIGMDQFTLQKLLNREEVHTSSGTDGEKGTGVGINLCMEVAEKNGGRIDVQSEPGKGSTFTLVLPAAV